MVNAALRHLVSEDKKSQMASFVLRYIRVYSCPSVVQLYESG